MYEITITNNFNIPIKVNSPYPTTVSPGETKTHKDTGYMSLEIGTLGEAAFIYLGEKKLPEHDYPPGKYGILVRFMSSELYYRYDDVGKWSVTIDEYATLHFSTQTGEAVEVRIPEITLRD